MARCGLGALIAMANSASALSRHGSALPGFGVRDVVAVAAGRLHNLALKSDGTVWAWGRNYEGELGIGNTLQQQCASPGPWIEPCGRRRCKR